ncbi:hypothetical protein [Roseateles paludis]|uniref:MSHA biogenesis protein MshJ n=1 Tax=Roseateles paludis TaxID=3145238 RepID=A0ABV0G7S1_9BURK
MTEVSAERPQPAWLARWERQKRRIDAMSLRERAILFFAMAAVVGALFDALVLTPLNARAKLRAAEVTTRRTEIDGLREKLLSSTQQQADSPAVRLLAEVREAEKQAAHLAQELSSVAPGGVAKLDEATTLPTVLQRLLVGQPGLQLNRLTLLTPDNNAAGGQVRIPGLQWQGVDLQIEGSFVEITRYLQRLELELAGLRWGDMRLVSTSGQAKDASHTSRLAVQLYVLRLAP